MRRQSETAGLVTRPYKQQWGAERSTTPLPAIHDTPSDFAVAYSRIAIVLTLVFWLMYASSVIIRQLIDGPQSYAFTTEALGYALIVTFLTLSALLYLIARHGALQAFKKHRRVPQHILDEHFATHPASVTVLVPSYNEEVSVIRKTLLSAALQETPNLRVVLLIDNKPNPTSAADQELLTQTRQLPAAIEAWLEEPRTQALALHEKITSERPGKKDALAAIALTYRSLAQWLRTKAAEEVIEDHVDIFFAEQILRGLATELETAAAAMEEQVRAGHKISTERLRQLTNRLVWIFSATLTHFERKQYCSLSHEPNKAMNLNSYIGIMGYAYVREETSEGIRLRQTGDVEEADVVVPDSEYLLTLDADSILLPGYCSRLIYYINEPGHEDVAVVQTPYSSFRGAPSRIERLAGGTTDVQHILHQGMSFYGAASWVGANAIIRKVALKDIVETEYVGGYEIKRYIQDHTVIEDTESSIDLALNDWRILSYPERLSYSATPPDFGSLTVQRLRWANGGLLIFPKLLRLRHQRKHQGRPLPLVSFLLRTNYLASIAWSSVGLLLLLAYPYDGRLLSPLVLLAAAPYFIAMAMDLRYCGYKYSDILRIYGFNLILLPINLAGTLKSLQQAITTKKIPFARTPKVKNRTATGWWYLIAPLLIIGFSIITLWRNIEGQNWGNAAFAGFNAFAATWAVISYIGIHNMLVDLWAALVDWVYVDVPIKTESEKPKTIPEPNLEMTALPQITNA
jgi:cellulose synthase/poly-beta-1,6-N-acetylglucosamine synthase-like glycosyltransferase